IQTHACDLLLMSGGFTPSVHLHSQSRGKLAWDQRVQSFIPSQAAERVRSAGSCRGVFSLAAAIEDGADAGNSAAADAAARSSAFPAAADASRPATDGAMAGYAGALPQPQAAAGG